MPLSPGDNLGPYEILSPIGAGGIQPLTRTTGVIVGSMTSQKGGVAAGAKANSEIHIMHTTGAMPYHTFALVQQLLGNGFQVLDCRLSGSYFFRNLGAAPNRNLKK
jgi:hypothetical protein